GVSKSFIRTVGFLPYCDVGMSLLHWWRQHTSNEVVDGLWPLSGPSESPDSLPDNGPPPEEPYPG
ncbi:hypothetical protein NPIL_69611, partial [Nephila pilipes]